jgi:hypothetical protein
LTFALDQQYDVEKSVKDQHMDFIKRSKWLLIPAAVVFLGFFFVHRLYHRDIQALKDFSAAYEKYDKAIYDFSKSPFALHLEAAAATDDSERRADGAHAELARRASVRISSLIKNDAEFMSLILELARLSGNELEALKTYRRAAAKKNADMDRLGREFEELRQERQTAYGRFRELAGLKD